VGCWRKSGGLLEEERWVVGGRVVGCWRRVMGCWTKGDETIYHDNGSRYDSANMR
jgi:hypothetical protein